jgi:hypothetical protein
VKIINVKEERGGRGIRGGRGSVEGGMQVRSKERELVSRRLNIKDEGGVEEEMGRKGRSTQGRERKRKAEEIRAICKGRRHKRKGKRRVVWYVGCRGGGVSHL